MYLEFETKTSYKYLQKVISSLKEPICILGGWGVFFHVNKNFQKAQGRPYLGSRDIDLGFHFDKDSSIEKIKNSSLAKSISLLKGKLNFKPVSFRLLKEVHTETEEEVKEGEIIPAHFIFPMYIDLIVDNIPGKFKEVFQFQPIDEPILKFVFENSKCRKELKQFNKKLWLPETKVLLSTKINALKLRDKEHKRIKDICDMFALIWYSKENPREITSKVNEFISKKKINNIISGITAEEYKKAGEHLDHGADEIKRILELLKT